MFYVTRYWYKYGREGDPVETTSKEYESIEKALAYAQRYATGIRFVLMQIEDEDLNLIYEYSADGKLFVDRTKEYMTKDKQEKKEIKEETEEKINNKAEKRKEMLELIRTLNEEYEVQKEEIEESAKSKDDIEKEKIKTNRIGFFISYAELGSEFDDFFITCDNILVTTEDICFFVNGCCISYLPIKSYDLVFDFVNHTRTCNSHHYHLVRK